MGQERPEASRALAQMAATLASTGERTLNEGGAFLPTLMVWYEGDEFQQPGAVVVFEPPEGSRPGRALELARERSEPFTRGASGWALAYEGLVSAAGDASAAIIFEAHLRRPAATITLTRRFRPRSGTRPFRWTSEANLA